MRRGRSVPEYHSCSNSAPRTAAQHTADELRYHGISGAIAVFSAPGASRPGERNFVYRDVVTGDAHCECKGAECGRLCWYLDNLEMAWLMRGVAPFVATLADDELLAAGTAVKARLEAGSGTRTDLLVWLQARVEWRARAAQTPALAPVVVLERAERPAIVAVAA
jgi:hypothetical protein